MKKSLSYNRFGDVLIRDATLNIIRYFVPILRERINRQVYQILKCH